MDTTQTNARELTKHETELLAYIQGTLTAVVGKAINDVKLHLHSQREAAMAGSVEEFNRLNAVEPERWLAMARTDFQTALMKLQRAVAQPISF